jgi:hypothetical protein
VRWWPQFACWRHFLDASAIEHHRHGMPRVGRGGIDQRAVIQKE